MSRLLVTAVVGGALVLGGSVAHAQSKGAKGGKLSLVEAMCPTGIGAGVAKCNAATFASGSVGLVAAKSPAHYNVPNLKAGSIGIKGLTPSPAALDCELDGTTSFGSDPTSDCALAGTTVGEVPGGFGVIPCVLGSCKGIMTAPATVPAECTDVKITVELPKVTCWIDPNAGDDTQKIATDGIAVLPGPNCTGQAQGSCK